MKEKIKIIIISAILLVSFSIFYYYVILPTQNRTSLNNCLSKLELEYQTQVKKVDDLGPEALGLSYYSERIKELEKYYERNQDYCFKKYPQR